MGRLLFSIGVLNGGKVVTVDLAEVHPIGGTPNVSTTGSVVDLRYRTGDRVMSRKFSAVATALLLSATWLTQSSASVASAAPEYSANQEVPCQPEQEQAGECVVDPKPEDGPLIAPPGTSAELADAISPTERANQQDLMAFKTWLNEVPGIFDAGYVESRNDSVSRSTLLMWAGDSDLQVAVLGEAANRRITASIQNVRFSRAQLDAARGNLWSTDPNSRSDGFIVTAIGGPTPESDGLTVEGHYPEDESSDRAPSSSVRPDTLEDLRAVAPEVDAIRVAPAPMAMTTRSTDLSPFNSGGFMSANDGSGQVCSSGFGIFLNDVARTITARHCPADKTWVAYQLGTSVYGTSIATTASGARVLTGGGYFRMFDGPFNDPTGYYKTVVGYADVSIGDSVCTSGGNSGVRCWSRVNDMNYTYNDGFGILSTVKAEVYSPQFSSAGAAGDSGGPVFYPYNGPGFNGTTVGAIGMIQFGTVIPSYACPPQAIAYADCYTQVTFTTMRSIVDDLGVNARLRFGVG